MQQLRPAVHRTILAVDVEKFADPSRTNRHQVAIREGLYRILRQVLHAAAIPWDECDHEDRGDGLFILAPPNIPKASFVDPFLQVLAATLHQHNSAQDPEEHIRIRVVIHAGEINYDDHGVTATSLNFAFRLLDAAPLKEAWSCPDLTDGVVEVGQATASRVASNAAGLR
jgi:hypothetical protein